MTIDELKKDAAAVAQELRIAAGAAPKDMVAGTRGGSRHRGLPEPLRQRFLAIRSALFQLGLYDPILVRFDSATVPQASTGEIAEELARVAETLR
jgi:hypothetical protein